MSSGVPHSSTHPQAPSSAYLPDVNPPLSTFGSPSSNGRSSLARSSLATTLGGGRDGTGDLFPHKEQLPGKVERDGGAPNEVAAEAQPQGRNATPKPLWSRFMNRATKNHCELPAQSLWGGRRDLTFWPSSSLLGPQSSLP